MEKQTVEGPCNGILLGKKKKERKKKKRRKEREKKELLICTGNLDESQRHYVA